MLAPGTRLGAFVLEEQLGKGGMGVVYKARDEALERTVALKVLAPELTEDPRFVERFKREARSHAELSHPNIMTVFGIGEAPGHVFLVLEYLPGGTLRDLLKTRGAVPWREAVTLAAGIADGLACVHEAGLVHRDVKPENVLLDRAGRPKLADFGLVRLAAHRRTVAQDSLTKADGILGTPLYMAPEQANEETTAAIDARADLYSLGATLYALVTGSPPFGGQGYELLKHVLLDPPVPPRKRAAEIPPELDALILRLLAKKPAGRPASAAAVADELRALVAPRATRSSRLPAVLAALVGVAALAALGLSRKTAPPQEPPPAPAPIPSAASIGPDPAHASVRLVTVLGDASAEAVERNAVALSFDGTLVGSVEAKTTVRIWDVNARRVRASISFEHRLQALAFAPDGKTAVLGGGTAVYLLGLEAGSDGKLALLKPSVKPGKVIAIAVAPDSVHAVAGHDDGVVSYWNVEKGKKQRFRMFLAEASGGAGPVRAVAFTRDGNHALAASADGKVRVWDLRGTEKVLATTHQVADHAVTALALSADGVRLATGSDDGTISVWSTENVLRDGPPAPIARLAHGAPVLALAYLGDGRLVAPKEGSLVVWSVAARAPSETLEGGHGAILSVAATADGRIVTGNADGTVGVYEVGR